MSEHDQQIARWDMRIKRGSTFAPIVRWGSEEIQYKAIESVAASAPFTLSVPGHGLPQGWVIKVESLPGIRGVDIGRRMPTTIINADTIALPDVSPSAIRGMYQGQGSISYNTPIDLRGYTARMQVREYSESPVTLLDLNSENGGIVVDPLQNAIQIHVSPQQSRAVNRSTGVYDVDLVSADGDILTIIQGNVVFESEVTR